ncbi:class I SAM-dependent methyltransferase [Streptomyces griseus]|uniref:class I SAM-dependent methyltransferase n=1 Tax=Streptomyces griseus TaxID=1911 RepID=UPI0004C74922|nr:SAM-dependent methyltransferase [Streptomyces griseus]
MTPTLVPHHPARDWAEIQERMLVPLYEAVYARLGVGPGTRLLGLDCGTGLALLMATARGAVAAGAERDHARVELARVRLPEGVTVASEVPGDGPYDVVTSFHAADRTAFGPGDLTRAAQSGTAVVLAGWGPPERCATEPLLRLADRLADRPPSPRADLGALAVRAGLRPVGAGRVACPFGYAGEASAVRGLLSTGLFDAAVRAAGPTQVEKEIEEALAPYRRADGTVWMPNAFRYVVARVP